MRKILGTDVININKGYFGVRRCRQCNDLISVNLIEIKGVFNVLFMPIKTYVVKRVLECNKCKACYFLNDEQWLHYKSYLHNRLNKKKTCEVITKLKEIDKTLIENGTKVDITDKAFFPSLDSMVNALSQKYGHNENLEEIISVYYS